MTTEKVVIRYFDIRGKAEAIRLLFEVVGQEYTEHRFTRDEWFGTVKAEYAANKISTFGQVPIVSVGDKHLAQTNSIMRYFAKLYNIYGATAEDQYYTDMLLDGVEDWRGAYSRVMYNADASIEKYVAEQVPKTLQQFEQLLSASTSKNQFGAQFSVADVMVFDMLDLIVRLDAKILASYTLLDQFYQHMLAHPKIDAYLKAGKRPVKVNNVPRG